MVKAAMWQGGGGSDRSATCRDRRSPHRTYPGRSAPTFGWRPPIAIAVVLNNLVRQRREVHQGRGDPCPSSVVRALSSTAGRYHRTGSRTLFDRHVSSSSAGSTSGAGTAIVKRLCALAADCRTELRPEAAPRCCASAEHCGAGSSATGWTKPPGDRLKRSHRFGTCTSTGRSVIRRTGRRACDEVASIDSRA